MPQVLFLFGVVWPRYSIFAMFMLEEKKHFEGYVAKKGHSESDSQSKSDGKQSRLYFGYRPSQKE